MKILKKLFGDINLTWLKLIILAVVMGVYTGVMAIIPCVRYSSFITITATMEVWIFFGIFIIMNSKSNLDSALKCFVFFLISQPLVYLVQVPFNSLGWELFRYYEYWFIWTILCLPMGYIGYYIKKDKWWCYLILLPMILITGLSYQSYLTCFTFYYPKYILISLFCATMMVLYPLVLFNNKKVKIVGSIIGSLLIMGITILVILNPYIYSTDILSRIDDNDLTEDYKVSLKDNKYGDVHLRYIDSIETYMVHADFKRYGKTELVVETPDGEKIEYNVKIEMNTYKVEKK